MTRSLGQPVSNPAAVSTFLENGLRRDSDDTAEGAFLICREVRQLGNRLYSVIDRRRQTEELMRGVGGLKECVAGGDVPWIASALPSGELTRRHRVGTWNAVSMICRHATSAAAAGATSRATSLNLEGENGANGRLAAPSTISSAIKRPTIGAS